MIAKYHRLNTWVLILGLLGAHCVGLMQPPAITLAQDMDATDRTGEPIERVTITDDSSSGNLPQAAYNLFLPLIAKPVPEEKNWPMAGANPQRTSWVS